MIDHGNVENPYGFILGGRRKEASKTLLRCRTSHLDDVLRRSSNNNVEMLKKILFSENCCKDSHEDRVLPQALGLSQEFACS